MTSLWYRDVTLGREGVVALLTLLVAQWALSTLVYAQTIIIPTLSVMERYDSNIFNAPKSLLAPDSKPEDFVTMVIPQINIAHANSLMRGSLSGAGLVTKYLHNPSLDYIGINVRGQLDLKNAANQVSNRISSFIVRGTYSYTPSTTGFGAPGVGLGTGFGSTSSGVLDAGLVTNRASRHIYNVGVTGGYQLTPTTTLSAGYIYNKIFFTDQSGGVNNQLFDTTGHQGMTTISTQISARDVVGATATMSHYIQEQRSGSSGQGTFTTIAQTLNWRRLWTRELSTSLAGGGSVKLPVGSPTPGQSVNSKFVPTVSAVITYNSFAEELRAAGLPLSPFVGMPALAGSLNPGGIMPPGAYTASMRYAYSLFPSYAFGSGPMNTHLVGAIARGGITSNLGGVVGMNYAHSIRSSPSFTSDTLGVTVGASYLIGPVMSTLSYNWLFFSKSDDQSSEYEWSKKMVILTFSYAFTSESFFRMGEFGSTGTQGSVEGSSAPSDAETGSSPSGDGSGI